MKIKFQNKPNWVDAPKWAKYLFMTKNGQWIWSKDEPIRSKYKNDWKYNDNCRYFDTLFIQHLKTDAYESEDKHQYWDKSLEHRNYRFVEIDDEVYMKFEEGSTLWALKQLQDGKAVRNGSNYIVNEDGVYKSYRIFTNFCNSQCDSDHLFLAWYKSNNYKVYNPIFFKVGKWYMTDDGTYYQYIKDVRSKNSHEVKKEDSDEVELWHYEEMLKLKPVSYSFTFEYLSVGDIVYSILHGELKVTMFSDVYSPHVRSRTNDGREVLFNFLGKLHNDDKHPVVFKDKLHARKYMEDFCDEMA